MLTSTEIVERRSRIFCRDEGIHLTVTRREAKSLRATKVGLGYSCDERVAVTHAACFLHSCRPTPISCWCPGPFPGASCNPLNCYWNNGAESAKPVWPERAAQLLAGRISNIRPKAGCWDDPGLRPFAFRSGSWASLFVGIPVINQHAFHHDDTAEMALARAEDRTHSAPRNLLEDLVVPETRVGVFIRFGRGVCRDSRSQTLHLRSARPGANTGGKVRSSHGTRFDNAGTRSVGA
jgi:hypothetical protein